MSILNLDSFLRNLRAEFKKELEAQPTWEKNQVGMLFEVCLSQALIQYSGELRDYISKKDGETKNGL